MARVCEGLVKIGPAKATCALFRGNEPGCYDLA